MSINLRWRQFASWRRKNGLFCTIVSWIIIAIIAYTLLSAIWGYGHGWSRILAGWRIDATHDPLDRIKVTLTALGGVGAVGYLVIKYRERAGLERGEADEKLVRAVQQLGDASPQVRIAGVYALADVADTYEGPYHQRVVDILCGYLRTDRLLKDANGDTRYVTNDDGTPNYDQPLSADGAVESTILFVLTNHLHLSGKYNNPEENNAGSWSHCYLDLHNACITETVIFKNVYIGEINASGARFSKNIAFLECVFTQAASFRGAEFTQDANFRHTTFECTTSFDNADFKEDADFQGTTFGLVNFVGTTFGGVANFGAKLTQKGAHFELEANFQDATFMKDANFGARIVGPQSNGSIFEDSAHFNGCTFKSRAIFQGTTFKHDANFGSGIWSSIGSRWLGEGATFKGPALFRHATLEAGNFQGAVFEGCADFREAKFAQDAKFGGNPLTENTTIFLQRANFETTHFVQEADFVGDTHSGGTTFKMDALFRRATFNKTPDFRNAQFNMILISTDRIAFPLELRQGNELPEGARWVNFEDKDSNASADGCCQDSPEKPILPLDNAKNIEDSN